LRRWIREEGFQSEIFSENTHSSLTDEVQPYLSYRPRTKDEIVILHHSIGSDIVDYLLALDVQILLIYHNVTPADFVQIVDPALARQLKRGRQQLKDLQPNTILGLGVSAYDEKDLQRSGYDQTGILPIVLDESRYNIPPNRELTRWYQDEAPNLLFVGRLVPNKRQEDLIKLLYYFRRVEPTARLFLVGSPWLPAYADWLRELADELEVDDEVIFTGYVSQQDLVTYYKMADVYISMSEHEGLGKPLLESMYLGVPIMAYAAAAVPETLGSSGILFHDKDYEALAELLGILMHGSGFRQRILARQQERIQAFLEPQVRSVWQNFLELALGGKYAPH
jgi:glycosyltransferase involved in cell wall biosynthesis